MKRHGSRAWEEIGYTVPDADLVNREIADARERDRREHMERKESAAAAPVRRVEAKELFAKMHAVVDGGEA